RRIRRDADGADLAPHDKAVAAFEAGTVALAVETCAELIAEHRAVRREPAIGERERGGEVSGTPVGHAIDAGAKGIASADAEPLRQVPVGAAAGQREADDGGGRVVIVQATGKAIGSGRDVN